ncbi:putative DNA binding domain-containing protein [Herbivorax sp. ANBcel31]|uniref:RNA-binding domain-containing protein n=1 Tax=Herbivorax sp. ANBcel31 TaxID=3069754 RepID=UPI0027B78073|nr:RNA-binding domain-containing protein [Herbivorax sp. ANBcel31]MDQ2086925.1 putative DNA binding domain-containing protein [Herbivorax sp. ANBcel31]
MDSKELVEIIQLGEDSKTLFKEIFTSPDSMADEIAAFANSDGGKILVGVNDIGEITGLTKENIARLNQMISNVCSQKIEPTISVTTENIKYDDKTVMVINVPMGSNKFYMSNGADIWVKVGADKRRARREELKRLLQESTHLYADEQVVEGTSTKDLNMFEVEDFLEQKIDLDYTKTGINIKQILENMKLMTSEKCTLGGLLLFGKKSNFELCKHYIAAVSWFGNDIAGTDYRESENIYGSISALYSDGLAFIKRQLKKTQNGQEFNSLGILEIPEIAIKEALVNAIIHRNYFIFSNIRIFVFDNRVEIISPGALPNTLNVESIKLGAKIPRNPILLSYIENLKGIPFRGIGSDVPRIIKSCEDARIKVEFINQIEGSGQFKVIFWRK